MLRSPLAIVVFSWLTAVGCRCGALPVHLTVELQGAGAGTVSSSPAGIMCRPSCSTAFTSGEEVTLHAAPAAGSTFVGWAGSCAGTAGACTLTLSADAQVVAVFIRDPARISVRRTGDGAGSIASADDRIRCGTGGSCETSMPIGSVVRLIAAPSEGSTFGGWEGECRQSGLECELTVEADAEIAGRFDALVPISVAISGDPGGGAVTSAPSGMSCVDGTCIGYFVRGQRVTLTAEPTNAHHLFRGWSGDCEGTSRDCSVVAHLPRSASARFVKFTPWARSIDTRGLLIAPAANDDFYVATDFNKPMVIDGVAVSPFDPNGLYTVALLRFGHDGKLRSVKRVGAVGASVRVSGLAAAPEGGAIITGSLLGSLSFAGAQLASGGSSPAGFFGAVDSSSAEINGWTWSLTGDGDSLHQVAANAAGVLAVSGFSSGYRYSLMRVEPDHSTIAWRLPYGVESAAVTEEGTIVALVFTFNGAPICGQTFPSGQRVLIAVDATGACKWRWQPTSSLEISVDSFGIGPAGQLLVAGEYVGAASVGGLTTSDSSVPSTYVALLAPDRSAKWLKTYVNGGTISTDMKVPALIFGPNGTVFAAGSFDGVVYLDGAHLHAPRVGAFLTIFDQLDGTPLVTRVYPEAFSSHLLGAIRTDDGVIAIGRLSGTLPMGEWIVSSGTSSTATLLARYRL